MTTLILVARPEENSLQEAARASNELFDIGIIHQMLLINGVLRKCIKDDMISEAYYGKQQHALEQLPVGLKELPVFEIPLVPFSLTGIGSLSNLFIVNEIEQQMATQTKNILFPAITDIIDDLEKRKVKIILTMGKGGVGKTTIASAIALGLIQRGYQVHLTTTDPAAHLGYYFSEEQIQNRLTISRIDPKEEVEKYRSEVLSKVSRDLDQEAIAYIKEDLESPCTEEIAIFQAFANVVGRSMEEIVVIDTAPTGHTLLLLDAAYSYHKELERSKGEISENVKELLPRLRNQNETEIVITTLPEATPVLEAERLQKDLMRAGIVPHWWVVNQSLYTTHTLDPILRRRAQAEIKWIQMVKNRLSRHMAVIPWLKSDKMGIEQINQLINTKG